MWLLFVKIEVLCIIGEMGEAYLHTFSSPKGVRPCVWSKIEKIIHLFFFSSKQHKDGAWGHSSLKNGLFGDKNIPFGKFQNLHIFPKRLEFDFR